MRKKIQSVMILSVLFFFGEALSASSAVTISNITMRGADISWEYPFLNFPVFFYSTTSSNGPWNLTTPTGRIGCDGLVLVSGRTTKNPCMRFQDFDPGRVIYFKDPENLNSSDPSISIKQFTTVDNLKEPTQASIALLNFGTDSFAQLSWTDNSINATSFKITKSSTGSGFTQVNLSQGDKMIRSYKDETPLTAGITYTYTVQSCDRYHCSSGTSVTIVKASTSSSGTQSTPDATGGTGAGTVQTVPTIPTAPTTLTASLSSYNSSVNLSWRDNSTNETRFEIYRGQSTDNLVFYSEKAGNITTFIDTSLNTGSLNVYGVRACNSAGCSSFVSNSVYAPAVPTIPTAPTTLTVSLSSYNSSVNLSWRDNSTNETRFEIYRGTSTNNLVSYAEKASNINTFIDTTPYTGSLNVYGVRACNTAGCSSPFTYSNVTVPQAIVSTASTLTLQKTELPQPLNPRLVVSATSVQFSWSDTSNETNYIIKKTINGGDETLVATVDANITTYTEGSISSGVSVYTIRACVNSSLCSLPTTLGTVTMPSSPTNVNFSATSSTSVSLSWNTSSNHTFYKINKTSREGIRTTLPNIAANKTSYSDTNISPGTYRYSIEACTQSLCSSPIFAPGTATVYQLHQEVVTPIPVIVEATTSLIGEGTPGANISFGEEKPTPIITSTPPVVDSLATKPLLPSSFIGTRILVNGELSNSVKLTWVDNSSNETSFRLFRSPSTDFDPGIIYPNTTYYEDRNLNSGTYEYALQECNKYGCTDGIITTVTIPSLDYEISNAVGKAEPNNFISISKYPEDVTKKLYTATVLSTGLFSVSVPDGTYLVEGIPIPKIVTLQNGKVTNVTEKINTSIKNIEGFVTFSDGKPVVEAEINAYKNDTGTSLIATTDALGKYTLKASSGVWNITIRPKVSNSFAWESPKVISSIVFSTDNKDETKQANFTVIPLTSKLLITVRDTAGNPVPRSGVIIDTLSTLSTESGRTRTRKIITEKTNAVGVVTINRPIGTYFIRVLPEDATNYAESQEQSVTLLANETKTADITLSKRTSTKTFKIFGTTKFDDGMLTNAYVSAWSDEGGSSDVFTTTGGTYTLTLTSNQTWHIKASKDTAQKSYKSDEQTLAPGTKNQTVDLTFVKGQADSLPPLVTVKKEVTEQARVASDDGARFTLPPNAVTSQGKIDVQIKPTTEASSHSGSAVVSTAYDITVTNSQGQELSKLDEEAEILIPYDEKDLAAKGVSLDSVIPSYYDESINSWISVPKFIINKDKKVFVLKVNHLTRFALIAAADTVAPTSPTNIVTDAITPTDVKITWNNPTKDFHHSKIYRSEKEGVSGNIVAVEVLSNSFIDKTYSTTKKVYYYTVRSVDSAGNESTNSTQIAGIVSGDTLATTKKSTSLLLPPGQIAEGQITRELRLGAKGDDVIALQKALKLDGFYATGPITGYYGKLTQNAVYRFQNYYKEELLIPNGYKKGTGVVGVITRKKINEIILNGVTQ